MTLTLADCTRVVVKHVREGVRDGKWDGWDGWYTRLEAHLKSMGTTKLLESRLKTLREIIDVLLGMIDAFAEWEGQHLGLPEGSDWPEWLARPGDSDWPEGPVEFDKALSILQAARRVKRVESCPTSSAKWKAVTLQMNEVVKAAYRAAVCTRLPYMDKDAWVSRTSRGIIDVPVQYYVNLTYYYPVRLPVIGFLSPEIVDILTNLDEPYPFTAATVGAECAECVTGLWATLEGCTAADVKALDRLMEVGFPVADTGALYLAANNVTRALALLTRGATMIVQVSSRALKNAKFPAGWFRGTSTIQKMIMSSTYYKERLKFLEAMYGNTGGLLGGPELTELRDTELRRARSEVAAALSTLSTTIEREVGCSPETARAIAEGHLEPEVKFRGRRGYNPEAPEDSHEEGHHPTKTPGPKAPPKAPGIVRTITRRRRK